MLAVVQSVNTQSSCDYCRSFMGNCRLIAGGPQDRRQFCSFVCYGRWNAAEMAQSLGRSL